MDPNKLARLSEWQSEWDVKLAQARNMTGDADPDLVVQGRHPLQSRWLGLRAHINVLDQMIAYLTANGGDLKVIDKLYLDKAQLERELKSAQFLIFAKHLSLPNEEEWRHPPRPEGLDELLAQRTEDLAHAPRVSMHRKETGPSEAKTKKKSKKLPKVKSKTVKVKKE